MEYRVGTCGACGAQFKVSATFQGDKAKCKACGDGVVEIGPVESAAPPKQPKPMPAKRPAPKAAAKPKPKPKPKPEPVASDDDGFEEYVPSKKKRDGLSMKERLLAERAAAAADGASAAPKKEAAKPAARASAKPAAKRAGAKPAATRKASAGKDESEARPARAGRRAGAGKAGGSRRATAGAKRGKAGRGRGGDDGGEGGSSRRGRAAKTKKKSPAPMIGAVVVLAIAGFGAWKFFGQSEEQPVKAAEATEAEPEALAATDAPETPEPVVDEAAAAEPDVQEEPIADAEAAADEATKEPEPEPEPEKKVVDPNEVDLSEIADFGPADDTTEEEWNEILELVETCFDPDAGAAGNRARNELQELGRKAFPAVVNKMKAFDLSTEQGYRNGDVAQRLLQDICNGTNAGWKYGTTPEDELFNRKVVRLWAQMWGKAENDMAYWANLAKLNQDDKKPEEEAPKPNQSDLDDLDDL